MNSINVLEYTLEVDDLIPHAGKMCVTTFMDSGESFPDSWDGMVLGSPFLRGFWSIWDFGQRNHGRESYSCDFSIEVLANWRDSGIIEPKKTGQC